MKIFFIFGDGKILLKMDVRNNTTYLLKNINNNNKFMVSWSSLSGM